MNNGEDEEDFLLQEHEEDDGFPRVATHSGMAHPDDVCAVAVLVLALGIAPERVIRTRKADVLSKMDILVDVGGEYDPKKGRFDHHQWKMEPWKQLRRQNDLPYASAGLIWKEYGRRAIDRIIDRHIGGEVIRDGSNVLTESVRDKAFSKIDKTIITPIDAADCGYRMKLIVGEDGTSSWTNSNNPNGISVPWGQTTVPNVSKIIAGMHPTWLDKKPRRNDAFCSGVYFFAEYLMRSIIHALAAGAAAAVVESAMSSRSQRLVDNGILVLPELVPWQELIGKHDGVRFVIYPGAQFQTWMVRSVPTRSNAWSTDNPMPEEWRGLMGEKLDEAMGDDIPDGGIFVRAEGFIGSHRRKTGAIAMAVAASQRLTAEKNDARRSA